MQKKRIGSREKNTLDPILTCWRERARKNGNIEKKKQTSSNRERINRQKHEMRKGRERERDIAKGCIWLVNIDEERAVEQM